jgi:hypothetical protein
MQMADGLEFELPSDVDDDEEIDEDMAFTAEDNIRYAGMFGDDSDGGGSAGEDLLASDVSEDENFAEVRACRDLDWCIYSEQSSGRGCSLRETWSQHRTAQRMRRRLRVVTAMMSGGMRPCWLTCGRQATPSANGSGETCWWLRRTQSLSTT